jgi:hypothetical protein
MRVKEDFFDRGVFNVGNGMLVRFWEDVWLGNSSLANQYPALCNIAQRKNVLVANTFT